MKSIKKCLLLVAVLMAWANVSAQDLITLRSGDEIEAKTIEISQDVIKYKKWSNQDGPTYQIEKSKVFRLKLQNGEIMTFNDAAAHVQEPADDSVENAVKSATAKYEEPNVVSRHFKFGALSSFGVMVGFDDAEVYSPNSTFGASAFVECYPNLKKGDFFSLQLGFRKDNIDLPILSSKAAKIVYKSNSVSYFNLDLLYGGVFSGFYCKGGVGLNFRSGVSSDYYNDKTFNSFMLSFKAYAGYRYKSFDIGGLVQYNTNQIDASKVTSTSFSVSAYIGVNF